MRLLTYNVNSEIINNIENEELYIVERAEDIDDFTYHLSV